MSRPPEFPAAACREPAAAALFAKGGSAGFYAKAVCNRCPERPECLAWGLDHERYGIWGGHGPKELDALRTQFGIILEEEN